jgi:hypothetical protein
MSGLSISEVNVNPALWIMGLDVLACLWALFSGRFGSLKSFGSL